MTAHCNDSVPMPDAHGMPWCDQCRGWHHDTAPHIGRPRRDIPKSGSRREAIEKTYNVCADGEKHSGKGEYDASSNQINDE